MDEGTHDSAKLENRRLMADVHDNSPQSQAPTPLVVADEELARRAVRDSTAFAELYRRYLPRVYRYVLAQLGDQYQAQDVTSQTFLTAFESIATFRGTGAFSAWLLTIARHKVVDSKRRQKAVAPLEEAAHVASREPSPEQIAVTHLEIEHVLRTLQTLAPERAEALALRIFGGLTSTEVAAVMGKSEAAVKMLVYRAVHDLQDRLAFRIEAEL
jgi:RNA polymerase sigma-70 factor (ECF subfamily)